MSNHSRQCYVKPQEKEENIFSVEAFFRHNLWAVIVAFTLFIAGYSVVNYRINDFQKRIEFLEKENRDLEIAVIKMGQRYGIDVSDIKGASTSLQK